MKKAMMTETCVFCGRTIPRKKRTNADRIREMTDEELATVLMCQNEAGMAEKQCANDDNCNCFQCLLDWLRELEAEGSDHERQG